MTENLNNLEIEAEKQHDFSFETKEISVYFKNIKHYLIKHIQEADFVLGCVAWLTDFDILKILASKQVAIIVQKEDFLRPEGMMDKAKWRRKLFEAYKPLFNNHDFFNINCFLRKEDYFDRSLQDYLVNYNRDQKDCLGIRMVGNLNNEKKPAFPRMHNKFVIFGKNGVIDAVWTGSYNFSNNSTNSLENAVLIRTYEIVRQYFFQWREILCLSKPLDWNVEWVPQEDFGYHS